MELSVDQIRIINSKTMGQSLIKGVAGSGKTTVALYKLVAMQQQKLLQNEKVLVVTYNRTLIHYMKYLCGVYGVTIDRQKVDIRTIDSLICTMLNNQKKYAIVSPSKQRGIMQLAIQKINECYPENTIVKKENVQFLLEEIDWIKSCRYLKKEEYMNVERVGRASIGESRVRLAKQSVNREAIFELFLLYEHMMASQNLTDYKTNALRVLSKIKKGEIIPPQYSYIIVDESQDLSRTQLEIIRELYKDSDFSSIIFIADVAQSIYSQSWLSRQSFKSIGFDMSGKSNVLSKNYRTTKQIALAAYSLINHDSDLKNSVDYVEPVALERTGAKPKYRHFSNEQEEFSYIEKEIKKCVTKYPLKDIVVVARNKPYLVSLKNYLLNHGIDAELFKELEKEYADSFMVDKVKLYTLHSIKGLEAPVVFIAGINEGILPFSQELVDVERKLLYVGMTRAKQLLYLTSSKQRSSFIDEIEPVFLQLSDSERDHCFDISIEDYQFSDKLSQVHNGEEMVRQWYLEQLEMHYGYPKQRIDVEVPIQYGSRSFFIDIVVYEDDSKEIPHIYIETKKPGEDLKAALRQVKSYLLPGNTAEYIVVTDGEEQMIEKSWNQSYIRCEDIPVFQEDGIQGESYCYFDFSNGSQINYKKRSNNELFLQNEVSNEKTMATMLPIKGCVAAGNLKYVYEEYNKSEIVPVEVVKDSSMKFILEVFGDSMIDFNILDGDYIIVRKQAYAPEGSIIVGGNLTTNEATLKKFYYDGAEEVILHPGNKKYQDIKIKIEDFFINGVVLGVIRKKGIQ